MEPTTKFTYIGPVPHADGLALDLKSRGLISELSPPEATRDVDTVLALVAVVFSVTGPLSDILAGVRAFKARTPGVRIEGLPTEEPRSLTDRLAQLDELHASGSITEEERAEQRKRLLGEL